MHLRAEFFWSHRGSGMRLKWKFSTKTLVITLFLRDNYLEKIVFYRKLFQEHGFLCKNMSITISITYIYLKFEFKKRFLQITKRTLFYKNVLYRKLLQLNSLLFKNISITITITFFYLKNDLKKLCLQITHRILFNNNVLYRKCFR